MAAVTDSKGASRSGLMALEMAEDAIALFARDPFGTWQEVGVAYPESDDFKRQIDWLRAQAGPKGEVIVWVPGDLVERHELALKSRRPVDQRYHAAREIAALEHTAPETLEIAIGVANGKGRVPCLSMAKVTRQEAETYARKWGFTPIAVTARSPGAGFGDRPSFLACESTRKRVMRKTLGNMALIGSIATTTGLSAAMIWAMTLGSQDPVAAPQELPQLYAMADADKGDRLDATGLSPHQAAVAPTALAPPGSSETLDFERPSFDRDWLIQAARWSRPSLPQPLQRNDRLALGQPLAAVAMAPPVSSLAAIPAEDTASAQVSAEASLAETTFAELAAVTPGPVPTPVPRPSRTPKPEAEPEALAVVSPIEEPAPEPGIKKSPQPIPRPNTAAARFAAARTVVPLTARATGPNALSVTRAAKREGLPLDRTSLIGIINVQTGREALLRLPSGRIQRIARGDVFEGWTVRLVGQDAIRLERGAERHTLILVTR